MTYSKYNALTEQELPIVLTLCGEKGYERNYGPCKSNGELEVSEVDEAASEEPRHKYRGELNRADPCADPTDEHNVPELTQCTYIVDGLWSLSNVLS